MSVAPSEVYARQLFPQNNGYPLYLPEPNENLHSDFTDRGVSIGDVGVIMSNGSFNFAFSLYAPPDGTVNCFGVPAGFQQMEKIPERQISKWSNKHCKGSEVMSSSIEKVNIDASGSLQENKYVLSQSIVPISL